MTVSLRAIVFGRRSDGILLVRFTCLICSQMVVGQKKTHTKCADSAFCQLRDRRARAEKKNSQISINDGSCPLLVECLSVPFSQAHFYCVCVSIEALQLILRQSYLSRRLLALKPRFLFFINKKKDET